MAASVAARACARERSSRPLASKRTPPSRAAVCHIEPLKADSREKLSYKALRKGFAPSGHKPDIVPCWRQPSLPAVQQLVRRSQLLGCNRALAVMTARRRILPPQGAERERDVVGFDARMR